MSHIQSSEINSLKANLIKVEFTELDKILKHDLSNSKQNYHGIFIKKCPDIQTVIKTISKPFVQFLNSKASIFIAKIELSNIAIIKLSEIQKFMKIVNKKIFLISIENSNSNEVQFFWRFLDEKYLWIKTKKEISKVVLNFLATSIKVDSFCGISVEILSNIQPNGKFYEVNEYMMRSLRGQNLLMIAAEQGDKSAVNFLLKLAFNVNEKVNKKTAIDLAWDSRHFDIVLDLLNVNSRFPINFNINLITEDMKKFIDISKNLQTFILEENVEEIEKILKENSTLRHFYTVENMSAPSFALLNKKFKIYEFLNFYGVNIGINENMNMIISQMNDMQHENVKEYCQKLSRENHLTILVVNSYISHNIPATVEKLSIVKKTFEFLDKADPFISLILQTIAESRDFKIIFDFDRSIFEELDFQFEQKYRIVSYLLKQIHLPAAELLDPNMTIETYGTIVHELCHYGMHVVYENFGRPYFRSDKTTKNYFHKISKTCQVNRNLEELLNFVFYYPPEAHHSKLIAIVPYMKVKYCNNPFNMKECRDNFPHLFEFCEEYVALDLKNKIDNISDNFEEETIQPKIDRIKLFITKIFLLIFTITIVVCLTIVITKTSTEHIYSCGNLTDKLRLKLFNSTINFQSVNVIFGDLFGRDSSACENLSPHEITNMLKMYKAGNFLKNYKDIYINFTQEENEMIRDRIFVDITGDNAYPKIIEENYNQNIYEELNPNNEDNIYRKYMKERFREPSLNVGHKVQTSSKFYVERFLKLQHTPSSLIFGTPIGFHSIGKIKLLLLSGKSGSGKSTYFRHMAWKLKRRFPLKWICFIDLKQNLQILYDIPLNNANLATLVDFLSTQILNLTAKVDKQIFYEKFISNNTFLLWDGIDEVSIFHKEILYLIKTISKLTNNRQWVSTRPYLEKSADYKLDVDIHHLMEFDDADKFDYITKFIEYENLSYLNISKIAEEVNKIYFHLTNRYTEYKLWSEFCTSPQILQLICDSSAKNISTNLYKIYEDYFSKIVKETYKNETNLVPKLKHLSKIHQHFAISSELKVPVFDILDEGASKLCSSLEINKPITDLNYKEILRLGIVYKNNEEIIFEDEIFNEFFIAQYLYENIWNLKDENLTMQEANSRLLFLFHIFHKYSKPHEFFPELIDGFIETHNNASESKFHESFKYFMMHNYKNLLENFYYISERISTATKFFKKDRDIINALWKIEENQTFFHEFLTWTIDNETLKISSIVIENFNANDRKKIFNGKNQAANFLQLFWKNKNEIHESIAVDTFMKIIDFNYDANILKNITNLRDFMDFLMKQNFSREEIHDFFFSKFSYLTYYSGTRNFHEEDYKVYKEYAKKLLSNEEYDKFIKMESDW